MSMVSRQRPRREGLALRMDTNDHTIKLFVSSPSDVEEERPIAQRALYRRVAIATDVSRSVKAPRAG